MANRVVTSFQPPSRRRRPWPIGLQRWAGAGLVCAASAVLAYLLFIAPRTWRREQERQLFQTWMESVVDEPDAIERLLLLQPVVGRGFPADAAQAERVVRAHPTLAAVVRRGEPLQVWVRMGEAFALGQGPFAEACRRWAAEALASREPRWCPPRSSLLNSQAPILLLVGPEWVFIKRWQPGSPEVERHLRVALGAQPRVRVGVWPFKIEDQGTCQGAAFEPPNLQTCPANAMAPWNVQFTNTALGTEWVLICQPWPAAGEAWNRAVRHQGLRAWAAALAVAASLMLGLWLRREAQRRRELDADRLAALLHSLKTPLALHKLRCDSLRMGRLEPAKAAEQLMCLGQEVDDLTRLIERALLLQQPGQPVGPGASLGPDWFRDMAADLQSAFAEAGRKLELELAEVSIVAHEASLQSALRTLLENAYHYGQGTVWFRTWPGQHALFIQVADQGPGLDQVSLEALGQPFMRLREDGSEGFAHEGQGLGLSLLFRMAQLEGWGLELESHPGQGLTCTMQVPG